MGLGFRDDFNMDNGFGMGMGQDIIIDNGYGMGRDVIIDNGFGMGQ